MPDSDETWRWSPDSQPSTEIDLTKPNIARVYDYLLNGKDNYAPDREVGNRIKDTLPEIRTGVEQQRALLRRAVRYLVSEAGVHQLIDIGSGLPSAGNVHEVAHLLEPTVRVVYVDNDPVVLTHADALLVDDDATIVVDGDVRRPESILEHPAVLDHIDLDRPVGLLLCGILHHIRDDEHPESIIATMRDRLPSGSHVLIHHLLDSGDPEVADAQSALQSGLGRGQFRTMAEIGRFFTGLDLVEPGLVPVPEWRPTPETPSERSQPVLRLAAAGVARKP